jgi:hypothetical protein
VANQLLPVRLCGVERGLAVGTLGDGQFCASAPQSRLY